MNRVLIVEDEKGLQEIYRDCLEEEGFKVECASNGQEAMGILLSSPTLPVLILLDVRMERMDGIQFRKLQLKDRRLAKVPVVFITSSDQTLSELADSQGQICLSKPFELDELREVVRRYRVRPF